MNTAAWASALQAHGYEARRAELLALAAPSAGVKALLLEGAPGTGKTALAAAAARVLGAELVAIQVHSWTDPDELFVGVDVAAAVAGNADAVRQPGALALAAEATRRGATVLLIDELDKAQERVEHLLLGFLQDGRCPIGPGRTIQAELARLLVIVTSNAQRQLGDALLRRVRRVELAALPVDAFDRLAARISGAPKGVVTTLSKVARALPPMDGGTLSVQELARLAAEVCETAETAADVRLSLTGWATRGPKGKAAAVKADVAAIWAEVQAGRRGLRAVA